MPIYEFECRECGERFEELTAGRHRLGQVSVLRSRERRAPVFDLRPQPRDDPRPAAADGGSPGHRPRRRPAAVQVQPRQATRPPGQAGIVTETPDSRREQLVTVFREASTCTRCGLAETRNTVVFGAGDADADLMFIGEAPGAEEDRRGPAVRRPGGRAAERAARGDRPEPGIRVHREHADVPAARESGSAARRARCLPAVPAREGPPDRAQGDRDARATSPPS